MRSRSSSSKAASPSPSGSRSAAEAIRPPRAYCSSHLPMIRGMGDRRTESVEALLPHTGTARLLTDVVRAEPRFIVATGRIPAAHPLAVGNLAPCFLGLEMGAQAAAALEALLQSASSAD